MVERREFVRESQPWTPYSPLGLVQDPNRIPYLEDPYDLDPYR